MDVQFEHIEYNGLKIIVNKSLNINVYSQLKSCADELAKSNYKVAINYTENRKSFFPISLIKLIESLGIDYTKENEFNFYEAGGLDFIEIWFDFIGNIQSAKRFESIYFGDYNDYGVSLNFRNENKYGEKNEFKNFKTCRLDISFVKERISN